MHKIYPLTHLLGHSLDTPAGGNVHLFKCIMAREMFTKYFVWETGIKTICRLLLGLVQIQQAAITCHSKGSLNTEQNMKISHQRSLEATRWQGDRMLTWMWIRSIGSAPRPRQSPLFPRCELRTGWLQELNPQQARTAETSQETLLNQRTSKTSVF